MNTAQQIKAGRERLGLTQEDLAERLDVSRQAVSKWEMGTSLPSPENMRTLAAILEVELAPEETQPEQAPPERLWKYLALALGVLLALTLAALAAVLGLARRDGWPQPKESILTSVYLYDEAGQELKRGGDGWYFLPEGPVTILVTFQNGREWPVSDAALFRTPTGSETLEQREQLDIRAVPDGNTFVLFRWQAPDWTVDHLDIVLECTGGRSVTETLNVTTPI